MLPLPLLNHPIAKLLFWLLIVITTYLMLMPAKEVPNVLIFWDKLQHSLCFVVLSGAGLYAYMQRSKAVFIGLSVYGALIEIMQSTLTSSRQGDPLDWVADSIGILLVAAIFMVVRKKCQNSA
jgi:VanZ family protein